MEVLFRPLLCALLPSLAGQRPRLCLALRAKAFCRKRTLAKAMSTDPRRTNAANHAALQVSCALRCAGAMSYRALRCAPVIWSGQLHPLF